MTALRVTPSCLSVYPIGRDYPTGRMADWRKAARAFSVPMESERTLYVFVLTHFLHAKPRSVPLRSKML